MQLLELFTVADPPPSLEREDAGTRTTQQVRCARCVRCAGTLVPVTPHSLHGRVCRTRCKAVHVPMLRRQLAAQQAPSTIMLTQPCLQRLGIDALLRSAALVEAGGVRVRDAQGSLFYDLPALTAALQLRCAPPPNAAW